MNTRARTLGEWLIDMGPRIAIAFLSTLVILTILATIYFFKSAAPMTLTITTGPQGSSFYKSAIKYSKVFEKNGVKLNILTSEGSLQNLQRLEDKNFKTDVGMVQVTGTQTQNDQLVSLGSISIQPLLLYYRGKALSLVSDLKGKKIAIGPAGTGVRWFALEVLRVNGIEENGSTPLLDWEASIASQALIEGKIDAAFIMGESASTEILRTLGRSPEIHIFNFKQANAYSRKMNWVNVLTMPQGVLDFGKNIPSQDITLIGPTVELIARRGLNPAISDLLLEAATEVHGRSGMFQRKGEFPSPVEHGIQMSEDATRYYKSGRSFWYRHLPYWLASIMNRIVLVLIPLLVVLIPVIKALPTLYRWRILGKIRRRYKDLLELEKELFRRTPPSPDILQQGFDKIERDVNSIKVPATFADQFYALRVHIDYVRHLVIKNPH